MAGDWMKIEVSLPDKPEVWQIAEALEMDPDTVVGKLVRVWRWFDQHTENGNAPIVTKKLIDREVGVSGFTEAMKDAGWMLFTKQEIVLPKFDVHNTKSAKNRALTQQRVKRHRNAQSVTESVPEKRREDIYKGDTPAWINPEIWQEFQTHRKEIKAKLTPTATKRLIANLDSYRGKGVDPNEALKQSIENQWRGVFPERLLEKQYGKSNGSGKETVRESKHAASERRTREEIARIEAYELEHFGRVS